MGTFTGTDQPYHEYDEIVPPLLVSDPKAREWNVPGTVSTFVFEVFVEADVPHPNGYVLVDPPWESSWRVSPRSSPRRFEISSTGSPPA